MARSLDLRDKKLINLLANIKAILNCTSLWCSNLSSKTEMGWSSVFLTEDNLTLLAELLHAEVR